ncbi:TPA: phage tail protein [Enterobacter hormaechei]|uniref:phage tail protein n=1 Tax=Enterobacter hormaechei TaxID=158836 RepID=UPI0005F8BAEE|nr:phage tail protein [Enterobacter hormaechei]KJX47397.1 protein phage [Enterobacter hormaechei subsp. xiangfangensis]
MTDFLKKLASMSLPSWMNKSEPLALLRTARTYWAEVYSWITWPLRQFDPLTCTEPVLNLIAYDRDISRFSGEPLSLYRKRVAYAFINARDAGSVEGFINIFSRLGIGYVELVERQPDIDWDVIMVRVTDSQIADNTQLMIQIIRQYGRTCRRYQFEVITSESLAIRAGWDQGEYVVYPARLNSTEASGATFSASL